MKGEWAAQYFRSENAPAVNVLVGIEPHGLRFREGFWPYGETRLSRGRWPGEAVRLDRGAEILVVTDRRFLLATQPYAFHLAQSAPDPGSRFAIPVVLLFPLLVLAAGAAVVIAALPYILEAAVRITPVEWEERIGRSTAALLVPEASRCDSAELRGALDTILARLKSVDVSPYTFHIEVADDPVVNALAAPGGYLVVYRGLLRMTDTPEELAGVLSHEMQHVIQRHSTRAVFRSAGLAALLMAVFGDAGAAAGVAARLGELSFARSDEESADREGLAMLAAARIDPAAMPSVFRKLEQPGEQSSGVWQYLSTHPATDDRIAALEEYASHSRGPYQPLGIEDWQRVAQLCR